MIRGVSVTTDRKPSLQFRRDWEMAMKAKKVATPTLAIWPLPHDVEIVDAEGVPNVKFLQLARLFTPALVKQRFSDAQGRPTEYGISWWKQATS